ncbi:hypothetical protein DL765_002350 [Monosporascus sp. GIB2]|nr:hypothetical protein DL765_002350 [Monosporascus sp. GIB2]
MADEFTPFNKLLAEIRMLVWEAALPRRYISFECSPAILGPPAIAQVCRESRAIALKNGSPHFFRAYAYYDCWTWYDPSRDSVFLGPFRPKSSGPRPLLVHAMTSIIVQEGDFGIDSENHQVRAKQLVRRLSRKCMGRPNIQAVHVVIYEKYVDLHPLRSEVSDGSYWKPDVADAIFGIDTIRLVDLRDEKEVESISQILHSRQGSIEDGSELVIAHAAMRSVYEAREQPASQHKAPLSDLKYWDVLMRDFKYQWLIDCYEHEHKTNSSAIRLYHGQPIDEANPWIKKTIAKIPEIRPVSLFRKDYKRAYHLVGKIPSVSWNGQAWERIQ